MTGQCYPLKGNQHRRRQIKESSICVSPGNLKVFQLTLKMEVSRNESFDKAEHQKAPVIHSHGKKSVLLLQGLTGGAS